MDKSRHAFGNSTKLQSALDSGVVDAYDILFLDGDTDPKIGWVDKNGAVKMLDTECVVVVDGESLPETGEVGKVYIFAEEGYFWNGTEFKPITKSVDLSGIQAEVATKVDADTVKEMIDTAIANDVGVEVVEF